jgi:hypothetical protein
MVVREASPGVSSSHRSPPGGAQRSWNDVRRCRAVLAAVPSSPWPPRRRTSIPPRPESSSFRSKVLDSLLVDGSTAPQRPGLVRGPPAIDLVRCRVAWKASFRLKYESPSMRAKGRSQSSSPGRADGRSSFRWSRCWPASWRLSRKPVPAGERHCMRAKGALMNLDDGHPGYDERLGDARAGTAPRCGARSCLPRSWLAASSGKVSRLNGGESEGSARRGMRRAWLLPCRRSRAARKSVVTRSSRRYES